MGIKGFTLIELLIVLGVVASLSVISLIIINPVELLARGRDTTRLADLNTVKKAIDSALSDTGVSISTLCHDGIPVPCSGDTNDAGNIRNSDGSGWVKVDFAGLAGIKLTILPVDPKNGTRFHYTYSSDGNGYELDAVLESNQYKTQMASDGGDNDNVFETGTSLTLLH